MRKPLHAFGEGFRRGFSEARLSAAAKAVAFLIGGAIAIALLDAHFG